MLDQAFAQIPDAHRHGTDILIRADSAGSAKAFLAHVRNTRKRGVRTFFSVGYAITEPVRRAVRAMPDRLWHPALNQDGTLRDGAAVAELTGMADLPGYPAGTRIIVRRERPHPGAQLSLFDQDEGLRHQVFLTDTPYSSGGSAQLLEVRHRGHATVEDHIRCGKTTGFGRFPFRDFGVNTVWLELCLTAVDLLAWARVLLLDGELAAAEPKKLRYRLLHVAARLTRGGRRLRLANFGDLALETRTDHGLPSPRRVAPSRKLTGEPWPTTTPRTLENPTTAPGLRHVRAPKSRRPPDSGPSAKPHRLNRNGEVRRRLIR